jgi:uncharacterized protein (TIGR02453 family)
VTFTGFPPETLAFLKGIHAHNEKAWFDANRALYEAGYVAPARAFVEELGPRLKKLAPGVQFEAKVNGSMSRINRDIRFSKDKRPYKTNIAGMIAVNGSNPKEGPAALYLHLGAEEFVGFGFYWLEPPALLKLRKKLLDEKEGPKLAKLVAATHAKGFQSDARETLKRPPPGVSKDHPRVELLKHKALAVGREDIPKSVRYSAKLKSWLLEQAEVAAPVVKWGIKEKL